MTMLTFILFGPVGVQFQVGGGAGASEPRPHCAGLLLPVREGGANPGARGGAGPQFSA